MAKDNTNQTVTLSDGRIAEIKPGKGRHAQEALKVSGGNGDKYMAALMAQLVEIDGKRIVMEDLEELDLKDFIALQTAFAEQNF
jgi:hypothetical protein